LEQENDEILLFYCTIALHKVHMILGYLNTCSKNDVVVFFRKGFCALVLEFGLELAEIRFRSNVHSGKSTRCWFWNEKIWFWSSITQSILRLAYRMILELLALNYFVAWVQLRWCFAAVEKVCWARAKVPDFKQRNLWNSAKISQSSLGKHITDGKRTMLSASHSHVINALNLYLSLFHRYKPSLTVLLVGKSELS